MNEAKAKRMFEGDCKAVGANIARPKNWQRLNEKTFLEVYCGVVFASGFKARTVDDKFPAMKKVFKGFDPAALARMKSVPTAKLPIKNTRKATAFWEGAKQVHREGWKDFKKRLKQEGVEMLKELPGIGDITKDHLAKDIGLVDTAKPDRHLTWYAEQCSTNVETLVSFLSQAYHKTKYQVDNVLFRYRSRYRAECDTLNRFP